MCMYAAADRACQLGDYTSFCHRYDRPHRQIKWYKSYMPTVMQSLSLTRPPDLYDDSNLDEVFCQVDNIMR